MTRLRDILAATRGAAAPVLLAGAAWLGGCTIVGPDYQRPEVPLPSAWRFGAGEADLVNAAWWDLFRDPDLSALIQEAIDANKDVLIATRRIEQFAARLEISESAKYPQIGYNGTRERVQRSEEQPALLPPTGIPSYNNYAVNLTAWWEIDVWGRIARSNEAARADLLASEHARRAVMLTVVTSLADTYVQLLARDRQLEITRLSLANRKEAVALLKQKYEGGSATLLDVNRAQAAVDELQVEIPRIELEIGHAENALGALLGRNPSPVKRGKFDRFLLPPVPQGVPSDVLDRRPDVAAAEQTLIAANARIGVAKSQYFPTVSLTAALGLASDQLQWLLARTARTGQLGAGFAGVLFDGGRVDGDVRQAEALQKQMSEAYLLAVLTALREIDDALVSRIKTGEQVAALAQRLITLQDNSRLARARYEGGQSTLLEVLDADRQVFAALNQQANGLREQYAALVSVYKAMGGGWMVAQDKLRGRVEPSELPPPPVGKSASDSQAP